MNPGSGFVKAALSYPGTWVVLLVTFGLVGAFISWFQPPLVMGTVAAILGAALLLVFWPYQLVHSETFRRNYFGLTSGIDQDDFSRLYRIESELKSLGASASAGQLRQLRDQLDALTSVFVRRLNDGQLGYGRYLAASETLFLDTLKRADNAVRDLHAVPQSGRAAVSGWLQDPRRPLPTTAEIGSGSEPLLAAMQNLQRVDDHSRVFANAAAVVGQIRMDGADAGQAVRDAFNELEALSKRI